MAPGQWAPGWLSPFSASWGDLDIQDYPVRCPVPHVHLLVRVARLTWPRRAHRLDHGGLDAIATIKELRAALSDPAWGGRVSGGTLHRVSGVMPDAPLERSSGRSGANLGALVHREDGFADHPPSLESPMCICRLLERKGRANHNA